MSKDFKLRGLAGSGLEASKQTSLTVLKMNDFKFIEEEEEEEENDIANDDSDIKEEGTKQYDEHFWCKSKGVPVGFTYKSKKQDFIRASEDIKSNFQILAKGGPKQMENLEFRILQMIVKRTMVQKWT